ncbi:E3 ubiquitin-protein ligase rififylin isoform X2 [Hyposmocoma kahamanoa]|uniref:E3 ubiquitin-protein ligase rififylin isoform X2 n=1 Tax=Hyposmocoma kahamanoa TaxID=1477025 RepID=UPI000E6D9CE8|nr:E3 ubiquitin-protein ligase rififylin isoform X2 [Hyposmocoma kahamanoa]
MPCENCGVQFSVFRRKRACSECERLYCAACLRRSGGMCAPCRAISTRPLARNNIAHLKVRDLQCFLQRQNVSTRGCVEKEELVSLCVHHVNSTAYRRRGPHPEGSPFSSFKGFTNNINDFISSALDLRNQPSSQQPTVPNTHAHAPPGSAGGGGAWTARRERFTTRPGGEPDIRVPVPASESPSESEASARVDTADCFEIEDIDDAGWEFVTRPAEPLPNDSEVLMTANEERAEAPAGPASLRRAASELQLRQNDGAHSPDAASLQDEPLLDDTPATPKKVDLESFRSAQELELLNVKQLKELLTRNRVEYRGCLERAELLERATRLWRDHAQYRDEVDNLPLEECCKICMAAPLECVLLECGHIAACTACSKQLAECPICRQYVVRAVRFFRS